MQWIDAQLYSTFRLLLRTIDRIPGLLVGLALDQIRKVAIIVLQRAQPSPREGRPPRLSWSPPRRRIRFSIGLETGSNLSDG
jgi:hypothetical protein